MPRLHEAILADVFAERDRLMSRRGFLRGGGKLAAGGALGVAALPFLGRLTTLAQAATAQSTASTNASLAFADNVDVLNYALTLEHLEYAFYRDGIGKFTFGTGPFKDNITNYLMMIRDHEQAHVQALTKAIGSLGGTPVKEATYDFGYGTDRAKFLATAMALENTGVRAYDGAGAALTSTQLLTVAGQIVAVEARHASYLNLLNGQLPFPAAFETPASKAEVLQIVAPFIVGTATPAA